MLTPSILDHYRPVATPDRPDELPPPEVIAEPMPGARVLRLGWHVDPRGGLMECHREEWAGVGSDGRAPQVYVSATAPGAIKGFHLHRVQTDRFVCLHGCVLLVLMDLRGYAPSRPFETFDAAGVRVCELVLDATRNPIRVEVPPGVAHGWLALGSAEALILNCVSRCYDGTDEHRCDPHGPVAPGLPTYLWRRCRDG